jgi:hypothetical protein
MTITFILHLITVCAFLIVSLALAFKFIVEAIIDYKEVTSGIRVLTERNQNEEAEPDDTFRW